MDAAQVVRTMRALRRLAGELTGASSGWASEVS
jgi:hypothetical protein